MISVVIPAFNEQDAIVETIQQVRQTLCDYAGFEIVVVDDGSSDRTGELAAEHGAKVVRHPMNAGYGRSLKDGIAAAANPIIAITDADGTYPIGRIPAMLAELDKGFHMAVGARTGEEYRESVVKAPMRKLLTILVEFTTGRRIPDVNSGLRVFRRAEAMEFFPHLCNTFSFTTSLTLAYMMNGRYISYMDIPYYKRIGTTKVRLFKDAIMTLQYIVQAILYYNPLKLFLMLSAMSIVFSIVCLMSSIFLSFNAGYYWFVGGILLSILIFCLGLLADLLRQIMDK
ncbi:Glycosyl transferase family 2 [Magnetospirillum sp. LM-5]|uniref:glycosyltransferase family 2 protein n=1 Tax=Magnetospirillum sp. LM-5 TaxID=2681466 RepID=UPI0013807EFD|nr:glycosyltransferase family 2 protein [Magnetospirillum sp. LM-5]CAA7619075.1 Glycosyl transferase family 2 [Magnetospirillum sp. LM-5]